MDHRLISVEPSLGRAGHSVVKLTLSGTASSSDGWPASISCDRRQQARTSAIAAPPTRSSSSHAPACGGSPQGSAQLQRAAPHSRAKIDSPCRQLSPHKTNVLHRPCRVCPPNLRRSLPAWPDDPRMQVRFAAAGIRPVCVWPGPTQKRMPYRSPRRTLCSWFAAEAPTRPGAAAPAAGLSPPRAQPGVPK